MTKGKGKVQGEDKGKRKKVRWYKRVLGLTPEEIERIAKRLDKRLFEGK